MANALWISRSSPQITAGRTLRKLDTGPHAFFCHCCLALLKASSNIYGQRTRLGPSSVAQTRCYATADSKPKRRLRRRYTTEEDLKIVKLHNEGYTYKTIAQILDRSQKSISAHLPKLGHLKSLERLSDPTAQQNSKRKLAKFTKEEDEEIIRLKKSGKNVWAIARQLNRSPRSITLRLSANYSNLSHLKAYHELKASNRAKSGIKSRQGVSPRDAATVVYLRLQRSMKWSDIGEFFPDRTIHTLRFMFYWSWRDRWKDVAIEDPRKWDESTLAKQSAFSDRRRKALKFDQAGGLLQAKTGPSTSKSLSAGFCSLVQSREAQQYISRSILARSPTSYRVMSIRYVMARTKGVRFSEKEDAVLLALRESGLSCYEIAGKMDRSKSAIHGRLTRLAFNRRENGRTGRFTNEEHRTVHEMRDKGYSWRVIADVLPGRTPWTVREHVRYSNFQSEAGYTLWSSKEVSDLLRLRNEQRMSFHAIAKMMPNRSPGALKRKYTRECERTGANHVYVNDDWTPEEDEKLLRWHVEGKTFREIASMFGNRSYGGVTARWIYVASKQPDGSKE